MYRNNGQAATIQNKPDHFRGHSLHFPVSSFYNGHMVISAKLRRLWRSVVIVSVPLGVAGCGGHGCSDGSDGVLLITVTRPVEYQNNSGQDVHMDRGAPIDTVDGNRVNSFTTSTRTSTFVFAREGNVQEPFQFSVARPGVVLATKTVTFSELEMRAANKVAVKWDGIDLTIALE